MEYWFIPREPVGNCRVAWFKGLAWGYMGVKVTTHSGKMSVVFDWTSKKEYAIAFSEEDALKRIARYPNEKLELERV